MATQEIITKETVETTTTTTIRTIEDVIMPPELVIIDKQVYCTSLQIAEHFEKEHKHVIRDIENAILQVQAANNPDMPAAQMFVKGFDEAPNNLGFKVKRPMYHLNVDGFSFLCLGYTGDKAAKFKLTYMAAFKKMRELLHEVGVTEKPVKYLSSVQLREIQDRITGLVRPAWMKESCTNIIWNRLRFIANADDKNKIPSDQFEAIKLELRRMEDAMFKGTRGTDSIIELFIELQNYIYTHHLCTGTPLSMNVRKQWRERFDSVLPKNISWRKAALMLEETA